MGTLTPGTTYIYERSAGTIYAREPGRTERTVVGYDGAHSGLTNLLNSEWNEILQSAETNPALQDALDRVKIIYNLSKQHGQ
jgi:hypothetical protein